MINDFIKQNKNRLSYASWVNLDKNFLYIETPKVACSTIKVALQKISGLELPENIMSIHYRNPPSKFVKNLYSYPNDIDYILNSNNIFKFCFVRNPYTRLVSAYKDKIIGSKGKFWEVYRCDIKAMFDLNDTEDISFENFVKYVASIDDHKRDIHWRSQFSLLRPDVIKYDFIGFQESFDVSFAYVLGKIGADDLFEHISSRVNETSEKRININLNADIKDLIYNIYKKDFVFFKYDKS